MRRERREKREERGEKREEKREKREEKISSLLSLFSLFSLFSSLFSYFFSLFSLLSFLSFPSSLQARMILPPQKEIKLEDLSKRAEVVFKGTCQEKRQDVGINPATKRKIPLAIYSFKVEEVIKGDLRAGEIFEVKQLGFKTRRAAVEAGTLFSNSDHHFETGKSYLLFLGGSNRWVHSVVGDVHGKYTVVKESQGEEILKNPFGVPETEAKNSLGKADKKEEGYREFVEKVKSSLERKEK